MAEDAEEEAAVAEDTLSLLEEEEDAVEEADTPRHHLPHPHLSTSLAATLLVSFFALFPPKMDIQPVEDTPHLAEEVATQLLVEAEDTRLAAAEEATKPAEAAADTQVENSPPDPVHVVSNNLLSLVVETNKISISLSLSFNSVSVCVSLLVGDGGGDGGVR